MTLNKRNSLIKLLFNISVFVIIITSLIFITAKLYGSITPFPSVHSSSFFYKLPFTSYNFTASMLSVTALIIYASITLLLISIYFENTQSSEIIFLSFFLAGCLCESVRFFLPLFGGLWKTYSKLLLFTGKIVFIGRTSSIMYMLGASIMSEQIYRQDIERNLTMLGVLSLVTALILPLDTSAIIKTGAFICGFSNLYTTLKVSVVFITFCSFMLTAIKHDTADYKLLALFFLLYISGYSILLTADNFLFLFIGLTLLGLGTYYFLRTLHNLYMWK